MILMLLIRDNLLLGTIFLIGEFRTIVCGSEMLHGALRRILIWMICTNYWPQAVKFALYAALVPTQIKVSSHDTLTLFWVGSTCTVALDWDWIQSMFYIHHIRPVHCLECFREANNLFQVHRTASCASLEHTTAMKVVLCVLMHEAKSWLSLPHLSHRPIDYLGDRTRVLPKPLVFKPE